jgi:hypothetical protein
VNPANWTVHSGTWTVSGGILSTSSANARLDCAYAPSVPWVLGNGYYPSGFPFDMYQMLGGIYRVYLGTTSDYVELNFNGTALQLQITFHVGGTVYPTTNIPIGGTSGSPVGFNICFTSSSIKLDCNLDSPVPASAFVPVGPTGTYFGIGTGATTVACYWDTIGIYKLGNGINQCPTCRLCQWCSGQTPYEWQAVVTGTASSGCSVDGTYILKSDGEFTSGCNWNYVSGALSAALSLVYGGWSFLINNTSTCGAYGPLNFTSSVTGPFDCTATKTITLGSAQVVLTPLQLVA